MAGMILSFWSMHFGSIANINSLLVISMHVVDKCEVVIRIGVPFVNLGAYLEMFNSHGILFLLEVSQS